MEARVCKLRGYADLHVHMFADVAHGGSVLSGAAYDPTNDDVNEALRPDYGTHRDLVTRQRCTVEHEQQPVIEAKRAMKPDGVVQAGNLHVRIARRRPGRTHARLDRGYVRGIGERTAMHVRVIVQRIAHPRPGAKQPELRRSRRVRPAIDQYQLDRSEVLARAGAFGAAGRRGWKRVGCRGWWHRQLVLRAFRIHRERGRELADHLVVLHGHDLPQSATLAIAHLEDLEVGGSSRVPGADEACMQRMAGPLDRHGEAACGKRLGENLAPEHSRVPIGVRCGRAPERARAAVLKVQEPEKLRPERLGPACGAAFQQLLLDAAVRARTLAGGH